jgi:hypothetical protein
MALELLNSDNPKDYKKILDTESSAPSFLLQPSVSPAGPHTIKLSWAPLYQKKEMKKINTLEHFYKNELSKSIQKNSYMTLNDLSKLMKYKLMRGKFRPSLQKKIDENNPEIVIRCTKDAIKLLNDGNWQAGLKVLIDNLSGVGIATASYIGAIVRPDLCPIMSDEVIKLICGKLDYTMKCYKSIQNVLFEKAVKLNSHRNSKKDDIYWTPYLVGEILFVKNKEK